MNKMEIGSFFEFETTLSTKASTLFNSSECFTTGRSIIKYYDKQFNNEKFLCPDFICDSVPDCITNNQLIFFHINRDFSIDYNDLRKKVLNFSPSVMIIVHYFGSFDDNFEIVKKLTVQHNMLLLEDFSQAFFSRQEYFHKKELNTVKFNNVRKYFGIPELSFISTANSLKIKKKFIVYKEFIIWNYYLLLLMKKFLHLCTINQPFSFKKFYDILETKVSKLPYFSHTDLISKFIFQHINFKVVKERRIRNYTTLKQGIDNRNIKFVDFFDFTKDETPFFAVISCKNSSKLKNKLIQYNIYPPNLWPIPKKRVTTEIQFIKSNYIFIPIDHRYRTKDMKRILKILNNWE